MNDYSLQPFSSPGEQQATPSPLPNLKIVGNVTRNFNKLAIRYQLLGHLGEIVIPASVDIPVRKDQLWEETCLEFFLGIKNSPQYWEFNLSPAGHWNVYCFEDYRQGLQAELAFASLPFSVQTSSDSLALALELNLDKIIPANQALEVAISAVIKPKNGEVTYWALTHSGSQADFHRRDSFIIQLEDRT